MGKTVKLNHEVIVPVFGGAWDGAEVLCKDLSPGLVINLRGSRYEMRPVKGRPQLHIIKGAS